MAIINTPYLDAFPKIKYNMKGGLRPTYDTVTDIFFRIKLIKEALNNASSYEVYEVKDGETPEILAERAYEDAGAGWMILYANDRLDPFYDWPLTAEAFNKYIIGKYGSLENAKRTVHHYEKVITRTELDTNTITETRFIITPTRYTFEPSDVPYSYWTPFSASTFRTADSAVYKADTDAPELLADLDDDGVFQAVLYGGSLERRAGFITHEVDGKTIQETVRGEAIYIYDWEVQQNEDKRLIKIIKANYYRQIMDEFADMTGYNTGSFRRIAGLT